MKKNDLWFLMGLFIGIGLTLLFLFTSYDVSLKEKTEDYSLGYNESEITEQVIVNQCSNLDLKETVYCMNDFVSKIYYYNTSNYTMYVMNKDVEFEKLKKMGGVCRHYSALYERMLSKLGYEYEHITLLPHIPHGVTLTYSAEQGGYCVIDGLGYYCVDTIRFENESK